MTHKKSAPQHHHFTVFAAPETIIFKNFFTFKPFRRRPPPVYCSKPERPWGSPPGSQPARVPARRVLQVSSRDPNSRLTPLRSPAFSGSSSLRIPAFSFSNRGGGGGGGGSDTLAITPGQRQ